MRKYLRLLILPTLALIVAFATGCDPSWVGNQSGPRVAIFTDSIGTTGLAGNEIDATLQPTYRTLRYSHSGWRYDQLLPDATAVEGYLQPADRVVIELGTNDAIQTVQGTRTFEQTKASIDTWRSKLPTATCMVFVEPSTQTLNPNVNAQTALIRDYLRSLPDTQIRLYDYSADIYNLYMSTDPHVYPFSDGVHPTEGVGQQMLADGILRTLATCP